MDMDKVDEGVVVVVLYSWNRVGFILVLVFEWCFRLEDAGDDGGESEYGAEANAATSMVVLLALFS